MFIIPETSVPFALVAFLHAHVVDDEVVDDELLRAHPPHPLLGCNKKAES